MNICMVINGGIISGHPGVLQEAGYQYMEDLLKLDACRPLTQSNLHSLTQLHHKGDVSRARVDHVDIHILYQYSLGVLRRG